MMVTINLSIEEKALAENYARIHNLSLEEAFKGSLFEKIEDECDSAVADEAYMEYINSGKKSHPISKLWEELSL